MKTFARWLAKLVGTALVIILVIVFFPHISRIASDLLPDSSSFGVRSAAILSQKLEQFTLKREKGNIVIFAKALFSITMLLTYIPLIVSTLIVMFVIGG